MKKITLLLVAVFTVFSMSTVFAQRQLVPISDIPLDEVIVSFNNVMDKIKQDDLKIVNDSVQGTECQASNLTYNTIQYNNSNNQILFGVTNGNVSVAACTFNIVEDNSDWTIDHMIKFTIGIMETVQKRPFDDMMACQIGIAFQRAFNSMEQMPDNSLLGYADMKSDDKIYTLAITTTSEVRSVVIMASPLLNTNVANL